jgi:molybdopterin-biosynthesis enzyme MoeA-like protein
VNFGALVVGDEILSGKRADKHLAKLSELLAARGEHLAWARFVGDEPERITADLRDAFASGDTVFSFGGIGATPDDHTRQCAALALGVPLALHARARDLIVERMRDVAAEQGTVWDPDRPDNVHRLNMGVFPEGADIIPNPYNKIPGFTVRNVHFVPGFPVMAWPMVEWVLDERLGLRPRERDWVEKSVLVFGTMEATLTPLMQQIEARHTGIRVFSLPSVDDPKWGRHIELGVKGGHAAVEVAYADLLAGLGSLGARLGTELVR